MSEIKSYHAHVYFNAATMAQAQKLCEEASAMLTPFISCACDTRATHKQIIPLIKRIPIAAKIYPAISWTLKVVLIGG